MRLLSILSRYLYLTFAPLETVDPDKAQVLQEPDATTPLLRTAAQGARERGGESIVPGWDVDQLNILATELAVIESQAAHRVSTDSLVF